MSPHLSRLIYKLQSSLSDQEQQTVSLNKEVEELKDRLNKIEEVYLKQDDDAAMNKLEELAKSGSTIDAATLIESMKALKQQIKVQIVDNSKTLKD